MELVEFRPFSSLSAISVQRFAQQRKVPIQNKTFSNRSRPLHNKGFENRVVPKTPCKISHKEQTEHIKITDGQILKTISENENPVWVI
eukprot:1416003-Amphidinium_carterae.1